MTLEQKLDLIKEKQYDIISALDLYIEHIYELSDPFYDKDGNLRTAYKDEKVDLSTADPKLLKFINDFRTHVKEFEAIRDKLLNSDFKLSLYEINQIAIVFGYTEEIFKNQINKINAALVECEKVKAQLTEPNEN